MAYALILPVQEKAVNVRIARANSVFAGDLAAVVDRGWKRSAAHAGGIAESRNDSGTFANETAGHARAGDISSRNLAQVIDRAALGGYHLRFRPVEARDIAYHI